MTNKSSDKINVLCFPYAGGSKYSYGCFESLSPSKINILPFELPGRGDRIGEPLLTDIHLMADDLLKQVKPGIVEPYVIYGHSMGAILTYLVTCRIVHCGLPHPRHLFISGCEGPSAVKHKKQKLRSHLPADKFIKELKALGGVPEEVLQDEGFLSFYEPILRADLRALEGYEYQKSDPIKIPISVIYGSEEELSAAEVLAWQAESHFDVEVIQFSGDHFFIFKHNKELISIIESKVEQKLFADR